MAAVLPQPSNTKDGLHNLSQPIIHLVIPSEEGSDSSTESSDSHSASSLSPATLDDEGQKQREEEADDHITMMSTAATEGASFVPPSSSSPISFRDEEKEGNDNDNDNDNDSDRRQHLNPYREEDTPIISSIMRQQTQTGKCGGGGGRGEEEELAELSPDQEISEKIRVTALEERVRDLEEKLSTLSLLLSQSQRILPKHSQQQQQQQHHQSPENNFMKINHSPPSPINSVRSISPSSSPFRSLSSYTNMPSSTAPVLESPAPMATHYQSINDDDDDDDDFKSNRVNCNCSLPYEDRRRQNKSRHCGMRNNLSFQILHGPNDTLDLSGVNSIDVVASSGNIIRDQSKLADAMLRIPSLDSLPGSERTSPVLHLPSSPVIAARLPPNGSLLKEDKEHCFDNNGNGDKISTKLRALLSPPLNKSNNEHNDDDKTTTVRDDGDTPKHKKKKSNIKSKWLDYLNSVQESNYDTDKQMEEFVKVPSAVEALLSFGFWISVDSFLYTLTVLPIRFAWSLLLLLRLAFMKVTGGFHSSRSKSGDNEESPFEFHRRHSYQLIQVSIIYIIHEYVLMPINISIIYHWIRVQSMVKLYLLVAIVEVFDRLMCSLGQDCLDSLYYNTTRRPRSSRLVVSALVVLTYTAVHSFLLFVHVATLNVAMNSSDQALLSLLIGGNFAEIKSTVFKKYNKAGLFKITASDVCERFKLALFLLLVLMLNASQGIDKKMLYSYLSMCGIVWCAEWLSDWLKHSFITKFNFIASGVYSEYGLLLAGDVSGFGHEGDNLDHSHAVVKRLGLAQIPLVCVMTKYLKEAYKYATYENQPQTWQIVLGIFITWLLLLLIKLSLESFLHRLSRRKLEAAPEFSKHNTTVGKKKN